MSAKARIAVIPGDGIGKEVIPQGQRVLEVAGPLDFSLTGVLASLVEPLARAEVSVVTLSTFDTDYLLIKQTALTHAQEVLAGAGHRIETQER